MLTKSQARTLIQGLIDDPGVRWTSTLLDLLIQVTLDELWSSLLEISPHITRTSQTLTPTSPGYIDLRPTVHGGQLSGRFFRVQEVKRTSGGDTVSFSEADSRDILVSGSSEIAAPTNTWVKWADQLWLFPLDATTQVEFVYSWRPTAWSDLAESAYLPWPDGYEAAITFEVAGRAMLKGAAEDPTGLLMIARSSMETLKAAISRDGQGPKSIWFSDGPEAWGSI